MDGIKKRFMLEVTYKVTKLEWVTKILWDSQLHGMDLLMLLVRCLLRMKTRLISLM